MPSWKLREGTADDMQGILACRRAAFAGLDPEKARPDYWRWEFLDNHWGPSRFFVADDAGRIVGGYAVIPQQFLLDGQPVLGSNVVDVMTDPEYWRQGMFRKLSHFSLDTCARDSAMVFTTGYPIQPHVIAGHLKVGWQLPFRIPTWVQVLDATSLLRGKLPAIDRLPGLARLVGAPATLVNRAIRARWPQRDVRVVRQPTVDERFGGFTQRFHATVPPGVALQRRTADCLRWRYDDKPGNVYTWHVASRGGELCGLAVSRIRPLEGVDSIIVLDLMTSATGRERRHIVEALLADVRAYGRSQGAALLAMFLSRGSPLLPAPWTLGFLPSPFVFSFITFPFREPQLLQRPLRWHLMWGDTDAI
jgi:GNAT superfamily N-acetyltransferase